jgi:DNA repair protein RadC
MDRIPELMTNAQLPAEMRPCEKLLKDGASALTDTELMT